MFEFLKIVFPIFQGCIWFFWQVVWVQNSMTSEYYAMTVVNCFELTALARKNEVHTWKIGKKSSNLKKAV